MLVSSASRVRSTFSEPSTGWKLARAAAVPRRNTAAAKTTANVDLFLNGRIKTRRTYWARAGRASGALPARKRIKRGTVFSYTLSEPGEAPRFKNVRG